MQVEAPAFTDPKNPSIALWLDELSRVVGEADEELVLVGHSLGCYIILRYLSEPGVGIAGTVMVAGGLPTHRPHLLEELDLEQVKQRAGRRICIYSDDDRVVLPERSKELAGSINAEAILDANKRHFSGLRGIVDLPSVLEAVKSCW